MMAGIYFALVRQDPSNDYKATLSGYLRVGGSMSVLGLITVSVEFNLSFTYDAATDKAYGRATLTVEVEVAFFSASVELTVERGFGGQDGDPKFVERSRAHLSGRSTRRHSPEREKPMAKTQTIVMTVIPRGVAMNADSLPVSVFVTPRLAGADKLGAFPDWLQWTRRLKENGLTLTLRCVGTSTT